MISKMVTTPLSRYEIAETKTFEKVKKKIDTKLFYLIEGDKLIVAIVDFRHRQQAYD